MSFATSIMFIPSLAIIAPDMFPITHSTVQRVFGDGVVVLYPHVQLGQRVLTSGSTVILRFFAALSTRRILRIALKTVVYRIFSGFFLIPVVVAGDPVCANVVLSHLLALDAYSFLFLAFDSTSSYSFGS